MTNEHIQSIFEVEALATKGRGVSQASARYIADRLRFERPHFLDNPVKVSNNSAKEMAKIATQRHPSLQGFFTNKL